MKRNLKITLQAEPLLSLFEETHEKALLAGCLKICLFANVLFISDNIMYYHCLNQCALEKQVM